MTLRTIATATTLLIASACLFPGLLRADDKPAEKAIEPAAVTLGRPVDFDKDVYPILDAKCIACHNVAISENGLNLEDIKGILKGGKRGPSVVAKEPDQSTLYRMAARALAPAMPPLPNKVEAAAVTPQELGVLRQWILEGASGSSGSGGKTINWQPLPKGVYPVYSLAVTADGQYAAVGRGNGVIIYHVPSGTEAAVLGDPALQTIEYNGKPMYAPGASHRDYVHALAFSPDGRTLASGSFREVKLWTRPETAARATLAAGAAPTSPIAISPDDKWLAVAMPDNGVKLLNLADGQPGPVLTGHTAAVTGVVFSADGAKLFTASQDQTVRQYATADGKFEGLVPALSPLSAVTISADGTKLVTGGTDKMVRVWELPASLRMDTTGEAPKPFKEIGGVGGTITALERVAGVPNAVVAGSDDGNIRVLDVASGNQIRGFNHGAAVTGVAASPDGKRFASISNNGTVKLWNGENNQQILEQKGDPRAAYRLARLTLDDVDAKGVVQMAMAAIPAAEKLLAERTELLKKAQEAKAAAEKAAEEAAAKAKTAAEALAAAQKAADEKKDDANLQKGLQDAQKANAEAEAAAKKANDDKTRAAEGIPQAEKAIADANAGITKAKADHEAAVAAQKQVEADLMAARTAATEAEKPFKSIAFSRDGLEFAAGSELGYVVRYDALTGSPMEAIAAAAGAAGSVAFTSKKELVTLAAGEAKVWTIHPGWSLAAVLGPKPDAPLALEESVFVSRVQSLAFNTQGTLLATGGGDPSRSGEVMLWNVATRELVKSLPEVHSDTVMGLEFSRDGKSLLTGAADKFVKIVDVESGKVVKSFEGHTNHVLDVAWRYDGKRIASAGADNAIKVWNVELGEQERTIQGYAKQVTSLTYAGRGNNLLSCGGDKTVRFHQADNGNNFRNFPGATDFMYCVAISENEQIVLAAGQDGVVRVWNGQNAQPVRTFDPPKPAGDPMQQAAK